MKVVHSTDKQILKTVRQLQVAYKLKRTLRYATKRNTKTHSESVAEHVFALIFLAQYFLLLEDPKKKLDHLKVLHIILFHDFGEIIHGDVPYHRKTKEHQEKEREAAKKVFSSLPKNISKSSLKHWSEYENRKSPEARFVYALDKIEPLFELLDPINEHSMKRLKFTHQMHTEKKLKATEDFPIMRKFVEVVTKEMMRRNVFWKDKVVN